MKNIFIRIGTIVAILLMFTPIIILGMYETIGNVWWLIFLFSIAYDFYMYSVIRFDIFMTAEKKFFEDVMNGKTLESDTEEKKLRWYQVISIDIIAEYFKNKK